MSDQLEDTNIGSCYAHISNGGVSYDLIKRDNDDPDNPGSYFFLSVGVSNHGHTCSTTIPLNKDSVKSLLYILAANQLMIESKDIDNLIKKPTTYLGDKRISYSEVEAFAEAIVNFSIIK